MKLIVEVGQKARCQGGIGVKKGSIKIQIMTVRTYSSIQILETSVTREGWSDNGVMILTEIFAENFSNDSII